MSRWNHLFILSLCASMAMSLPTDSLAGNVRLKNGTIINGTPQFIQNLDPNAKRGNGEIAVHSLILVDNGIQRFFVPRRRVHFPIDQSENLSKYVTFEFEDHRRTKSQLRVARVGKYTEVSGFSKFGRRTITIQTGNEKKPEMNIIQAVKEINPHYLAISALNANWEMSLRTTSIPKDELDGMLRHVTDQTNPQERLGIARFYQQAGMYVQAVAELESMRKDFPELNSKIDEIDIAVRQVLAKRLLHDLSRRRAAGQHYLAYRSGKRFPTKNMSAAILREVRELVGHYDEAREKGDKALALLGDLHAELPQGERMQQLAPMRSMIREKLDYESLDRLDAFLKLADDQTLTADKKLALAYSGWMVGAENAADDLDLAINLSEAQFLVMEYVRSDDKDARNRILEKLDDLESVSPARIAQLIPNLPPVIETSGLVPGTHISLEAKSGDPRIPVKYSVLLPPEYNSHHIYPMIVALHPSERPADHELTWWGGDADDPLQAQRRGYIVIAPEYATPKLAEYDYSARAHYVVLQALRDARKRFSVDSDRVFLAGHGMGGDAAFDLGMSHPDVFAGVIPITGVIGEHCRYYWKNASEMPWYVVGGELDRDSFEKNVFHLNEMLKRGYDMIFTEYIGRGYESYYAEIHNLFDWMELHRRSVFPREIDVEILRPFDNRFFWVKMDDFPKNVKDGPLRAGGGRVNRPMPLSAEVTPGNTVRINRSGAKKHTFWLSPDFVDFDKRVKVRINNSQKMNDFIEPDTSAILEDFRIRGDRQKIYQVKLEF
ncbi:MAG: hypothetical protein CMJ78_11255 [Planctomycetaceae bacterium]|nr:hypothetical protein [Planctomycetaceae bacterium]